MFCNRYFHGIENSGIEYGTSKAEPSEDGIEMNHDVATPDRTIEKNILINALGEDSEGKPNDSHILCGKQFTQAHIVGDERGDDSRCSTSLGG